MQQKRLTMLCIIAGCLAYSSIYYYSSYNLASSTNDYDMPASETENGDILDFWNESSEPPTASTDETEQTELLSYSGDMVVVQNDNIPDFSGNELTSTPILYLSELDSLGRTGRAYAVCGPETITHEQRGSISDIKPSGWHTVRYDDLIEDKYLFNRCHEIAWAIYGGALPEQINSQCNLFTGTRQLNLKMLEYELQVLYCIEDYGFHVAVECIPIYEGNELVPRMIQYMAASIEDNAASVSINVIIFNVQDNIVIDYATGDSWRE